MTAEPKKIASIGFVDTFENGHLTGWAYTDSSEAQNIHLKINGFFVKTIPAIGLRPDVKAAGIKTEKCGFNFRLILEDLPQDGCSISLHETVFGNTLTNGALYYQNGKIVEADDSNTGAGTLPIASYISIYNSTSSNQDTTALLDLSLKALGKLPANTLIAMSYLLILGRIPDPDGFRGSLKFKLTSDREKRDFLANVINSSEFAAKRSIASATVDLEKFMA